MASTIAWLDASREEQRRAREMINLFSQSESRDELGVGQIRDAFSDILFPGTSTLHRRARYLLLIPWCYLAEEARAADAADLERRAAQNERRLIERFLKTGVTDGLIGKEAGPVKLKTLPSALYWSALARYGIRVGDIADAIAGRRWDSEADELVERRPRMWNAPEPPRGFPSAEDRLDLSQEEAVWLKERILSGARGSLLEQLLLNDDDSLDGEGPWTVAAGTEEIGQILQHARLFSAAMQAAALSYNLAIALRYEQAGHRRVEEPVASYRDRIEDWYAKNAGLIDALPTWNLLEMWARVRMQNPNIGVRTVGYVEQWVALLASGENAGSDRALQLVSAREVSQKRGLSRLDNPRLLENWSGASGTQLFTYRWSNVTATVSDVRAGIVDAGA